MHMQYFLQYEVWKHYPYHNATDDNIEKYLDFCHDLVSLINIGKIQVEILPRGWYDVEKKERLR